MGTVNKSINRVIIKRVVNRTFPVDDESVLRGGRRLFRRNRLGWWTATATLSVDKSTDMLPESSKDMWLCWWSDRECRLRNPIWSMVEAECVDSKPMEWPLVGTQCAVSKSMESSNEEKSPFSWWLSRRREVGGTFGGSGIAISISGCIDAPCSSSSSSKNSTDKCRADTFMSSKLLSSLDRRLKLNLPLRVARVVFLSERERGDLPSAEGGGGGGGVSNDDDWSSMW
mmetsp:Transcript_15029/g.28741  ORF Transcript_15029/g.28741 Transcript_15029/m.28741 type:complete len:228 (-) Transcript_15029:398-1081(-)